MTIWTATPSYADDIPPPLEMTIHLKILSFDNGLKERATADTIWMGVLHTSDQRSLANEYVNAVGLLTDKNNVRVHRKKVRAVAIPITADLADRLSGINALYVLDNVTAEHVAAIARIASARKLPTLSGDRAHTASGIAVAVVLKKKKPSIVVHAGNAGQCGMSLDAKLLRLAEVVK